MKIAYITHSFPPNGGAAAINTYRIVEGLVARGHELSVFCPQIISKYGERFELQNKDQPYPFKVHYSLPTSISLSLTIPHLLGAFKVLIREYDLLITQFHLFHMASFVGLPLKILRGKPWMIKVHDMVFDPAIPTPVSKSNFINSCYEAYLKACYGMFVRRLGKKADRLLVLTSELHRLLLENGYQRDKVVVVPNGVNIKIFSPSISEGDSLRRKTILYVGSMMPEDGLAHLVRAFALIHRNTESNLVLLGDGSERLPLIKLVTKLNLREKVTFQRFVPHERVPEFIRAAYVTVGPLCISPINYYTIPTKLLEYFACGKPAVSSPVSKDILIDGFNGFVVNEATPKNIAEKLSILLEDEKLANEMGKSARQLVADKFDWERVIDQIEVEIRCLESRRFD